MKFHLTVTRKGIVSLWDEKKAAQSVASRGHEAYLVLKLSKKQDKAILKARKSIKPRDSEKKEAVKPTSTKAAAKPKAPAKPKK